MTYHKIRNVDLKVCTAEQKIAYNLAFSYSKLFIDEEKFIKLPFEFQKRDVIHNAVRAIMQFFPKDSKYDIDLVFCALNAGLQNYIESTTSILSSYAEIGKMFPALYLEK